MTRFLTDAWLAELDAAVRATVRGQDDAVPGRFVVSQVVTGAPTGDVRYALVLDGGDVHVGRDPGVDADATFTEDYETAAAIHRGELSPQQAFMTGRIRVSGNISAVMANQDALVALEPALAAVRDGTTY